MLTWILGTLVVLLTAALGGSVYFLLRIAKKVWDLEEQVEESLDIIDDVHRSIDGIAQLPVISDDPTIQQLVLNIQRARDALKAIAVKVGGSFGAEVEGTGPSVQDERRAG